MEDAPFYCLILSIRSSKAFGFTRDDLAGGKEAGAEGCLGLGLVREVPAGGKVIGNKLGDRGDGSEVDGAGS